MTHIVLNAPLPPWSLRVVHKTECGSARDLEAKAAARYEASRAAYETEHPESYAAWVTVLAEHHAACQAIFNAPSIDAAKTRAAAATGLVAPILAERIEGADKLEVNKVARAAKKTTMDAARRALIPPM